MAPITLKRAAHVIDLGRPNLRDTQPMHTLSFKFEFKCCDAVRLGEELRQGQSCASLTADKDSRNNEDWHHDKVGREVV
jgi:hypothetical protein